MLGYGMGYSMMGFFSGLVTLALAVWFVIFTVIILGKLDEIIELLKKK